MLTLSLHHFTMLLCTSFNTIIFYTADYKLINHCYNTSLNTRFYAILLHLILCVTVASVHSSTPPFFTLLSTPPSTTHHHHAPKHYDTHSTFTPTLLLFTPLWYIFTLLYSPINTYTHTHTSFNTSGECVLAIWFRGVQRMDEWRGLYCWQW